MFVEGEIIKIREWKDMVNEFGTMETPSGVVAVRCECYFTTDMKFMCGNDYKIKRVTDKGNYELHGNDFFVSNDMICKKEVIIWS